MTRIRIRNSAQCHIFSPEGSDCGPGADAGGSDSRSTSIQSVISKIHVKNIKHKKNLMSLSFNTLL
jgi:hypothetical protein